MTREADKKCDTQVNVVRRVDGTYSATLVRKGYSKKISGCEWSEVQRLLGEIEPRSGSAGAGLANLGFQVQLSQFNR